MNNLNQAIKLLKQAIELLEGNSTNSSSNNVSKLQSIVNTNKPKNYFHKDREFIQNLLELQKHNNNNTSFLESLLSNEYDTLTEGQYQVVVSIANTYNLSPDGN